MEIYIQQHVFSWRDRFTIWDAQGNDLFYAKGELFRLGKCLHVTDTAEQEVLTVEQRFMTMLPRYGLSVHGREIGELVKRFSLFTPAYAVGGLGWKVEGDFFGHEYEITDGSRRVGRLEKRWFTVGDSYALEVADPAELLPALAVVLAIDCATADD